MNALQEKYLTEVGHRLHRAGFEAGPEYNGLLPIKKDVLYCVNGLQTFTAILVIIRRLFDKIVLYIPASNGFDFFNRAVPRQTRKMVDTFLRFELRKFCLRLAITGNKGERQAETEQ